MFRRAAMAAAGVLALMAIAAAVALWAARPRARQVDPPALVLRMRDVARLETLDVSLYKKVSFEPPPEPSNTLLGDALTWAKFTLRPPHGKAIVFADVHLGVDLAKLTPSSMRVQGQRVEIALPPVVAQVELKPGETEVIGSNLDSQQTAQLFQVAREAFEQEVSRDPRLKERARASAERALRALLLELGYRDVVFVEALKTAGAG